MGRISLNFILFVSLLGIGLSGCGGNSSPVDQKLSLDGKEDSEQQDPTEKKDVDYSTFTLYLKTKKEFKSNSNITINYMYDSDGYLAKSTKSDSSNGDVVVNEYRYFENHKILKVYEDDNLVKLAIFEPKQGTLNYNIASINRLSLVSKKQYFYHTFDTVIRNLQVKSIVTDMELGLNYTDFFNYDDNGFLTKMQNGRYKLNPDVQAQLSNDTNTSFLLEHNATIMPFFANESQNYLYEGNRLKTVQFDNYDDGDIEVSSDVNISYHKLGVIKDIKISTGDSWNYNEDGILISSKTAKDVQRVYKYSNDYKTVTVTDANGKRVKQYIFDELK